MSEKIVIIGNGFDLRHFLPTRYDHLITVLEVIEDMNFGNEIENDFDELFGTLFKEKDKWFFEKINEYYETKNIYFETEGLKSIQERVKNNSWFQYLKSIEVNKIETWIDFETEINRALKNIGDYFDKFNNDGFPQLKKQSFGRDGYNINNDFADNFFQNRLQRNILIFFNLFISQPRSSYIKLNLDKVLVIEKSIQHFKEKDFFDSIYHSLEEFIGIFNDYIILIVNNFYRHFKEEKKENFIFLKNSFLFDKVSHIYSFNYTNTYEMLYKYKDNTDNVLKNRVRGFNSNIEFLHGKSIENWESNVENLQMVLGVNDIDPLLKNHKLFQFTKYFQKLHKGTDYLFLDEIIKNIESGITSYRFDFIFWGHSLDISDKDYIDDVFRIVMETQSKIKIFYHNISAKADQLKNLLSVIQDKNIIESLMKSDRLQFIESTPENLFKELA